MRCALNEAVRWNLVGRCRPFVDPLEYSKSVEPLTAVDANLFLKASIAPEQLGGLLMSPENY